MDLKFIRATILNSTNLKGTTFKVGFTITFLLSLIFSVFFFSGVFAESSTTETDSFYVDPTFKGIEMDYQIEDIDKNTKLIKLNLDKNYNLSLLAKQQSKKSSDYLNLQKTKYYGDINIKLMEKVKYKENVTTSSYPVCTGNRKIEIINKNTKLEGNNTKIKRTIYFAEDEAEFSETKDLLENEKVFRNEFIQDCKTKHTYEEVEKEKFVEINPENFILKKDHQIYEVFEGFSKIEKLPDGKWGYSVWTDINVLGVKIKGATWWNVSYAKKMGINCTNMETDQPFVINGSSGFIIGGKTQIVWTKCSGTGNAVYYNTYSDYVVANDTHQLPFEVEKGNSTSYTPTSVWGSGYRAVYHFGEGTGTNASDSTSNAEHGTITNASWETGMIGNCLGFGGAEYVTLTDIDLDASFTLEAWVNSNKTGTMGRPFSKYHEGTIIPISMFLLSNVMYFDFRCSGNHLVRVIGGTTVSDGNWHSLSGKRSVADDKSYLYLNGSEDATPVTDTTTGSLLNNENILIGARPYTPMDNFWDGYLDEIRFSNVSRSADWINASYQNVIGTAGYGMLGDEESSGADQPPSVNLNTPADNQLHTEPHSYTFNCSATDDNDVVNLTLLIYNGTSDEIYSNTTTFAGSSDTAVSIQEDYTLTANKYTWKCRAYDNATNSTTSGTRDIFVITNQTYYRNVNITNTGGTTNQTIKISLNLSIPNQQGKIKNDCSNLYFQNSTGTNLSYCIYSCALSSNDNAAFHISFPYISNTTNTTIKMYYGNVTSGNNDTCENIRNDSTIYSDNFTAKYIDFSDNFDDNDVDRSMWWEFIPDAVSPAGWLNESGGIMELHTGLASEICFHLHSLPTTGYQSENLTVEADARVEGDTFSANSWTIFMNMVNHIEGAYGGGVDSSLLGYQKGPYGWGAYNDDSGGSRTTVNITTDYNKSEWYHYKIEANTGGVYYYINNTLEATITTHMPTSNQMLAHIAMQSDGTDSIIYIDNFTATNYKTGWNESWTRSESSMMSMGGTWVKWISDYMYLRSEGIKLGVWTWNQNQTPNVQLEFDVGLTDSSNMELWLLEATGQQSGPKVFPSTNNGIRIQYDGSWTYDYFKDGVETANQGSAVTPDKVKMIIYSNGTAEIYENNVLKHSRNNAVNTSKSYMPYFESTSAEFQIDDLELKSVGAISSQSSILGAEQGEGATSPTYSENSTNTTIAGASTLFSLKWEDETALSGYIFGFYNGSNTTYCDGTASSCNTWTNSTACGWDAGCTWTAGGTWYIRTDDDGTSSSAGTETVTFMDMPNTSYSALATALTDDDTIYSMKVVTKEVGTTSWWMENDQGQNEITNYMYGAILHGHVNASASSHVECGSEVASASSFAVTFDTNFPDTSYSAICNPLTDSDSPICIQDDDRGKAVEGLTFFLNDDSGNTETGSGIDWCIFQHGEYDIGEVTVKAGSEVVTDGAMSVTLTTEFPDTSYVVFITDATSYPDDGCACEVTERLVGSFTALCEDDGGSSANCDETFDWVAIEKGDFNSSLSSCSGTADSCGTYNSSQTNCTQVTCDWNNIELVSDSWVAMIGTLNWSNVTKIVNSTVGTTIKWNVSANDTSGNWNTSATYSYVTISGGAQNYTRSVSDSLSISPVVIKEGELNRESTDSLSLSPLTEKLSNFGRIFTETPTISSIISRLQTLTKSILDSLSLSGLSERISTLIRPISDSLSLSLLTERISTLIRPLTNLLGITESIDKTYTGIRESESSITLTPEIIRTLELNRDATNSFTLSLSLIRQLNQDRETTDSITLTPELLRAVEQYRKNNDTTTITTELNRQLILQRETTTSTTISVLIDRLFLPVRMVTASLGITSEVGKTYTGIRTPTQAITLTPELLRTLEINRDTELTLTITPEMQRQLELNRNPTTTLTINLEISKGVYLPLQIQITITPDLARELNLNRDNTLTATITPEMLRDIDLTRLLSQDTTISSEVLRELLIERTTQTTITLTPELVRILEANRETQDTLTLSLILIREFTQGRNIADSITITPELLRAVEQYRNTNDTTNIAAEITRQLELNRKVEDSFSFSLILDRLFYPIRTIAQALGITESTDRTYTGTRITETGITLTPETIRTLELDRETQDAMTLTLNLMRQLNQDRKSIDSLIITSELIRAIELSRYTETGITLTPTILKELEITRPTELTLTITSEMQRQIELNRDITTTITINLEISKGIYLPLQIDITITPELARELELNRLNILSMTITSDMLRDIDLTRLLSQDTTISSEVLRELLIERTPTQGIILTPELLRTLELNRDTQDSFTLSLDLIRELNLNRNPDDSITLTPELIKAVELFRETQDSTAIATEINRQLELNRQTTEGLSLSTIFDRTLDITRTITSPITILINLFSQKEGTYSEDISLSITFNTIAERTTDITKGITDSLSLSTLTDRISTLIRPLTNLLGFTESIDKTYTGIRTPTQAITLTPELIRAIEITRPTELTLTITSEMQRQIELNRDITTTITINLEISKGIYLPLQIDITITPELARELELNRLNILSMTITSDMLRDIDLTRLLSQDTTISSEVLRELLIERTPTQGISLSLLTDRTQDIARTLTSPIQWLINMVSTKIESGVQIRNIQLSVTISTIADKTTTLSRDITDSLSLSALTDRLSTLIRLLTNSLGIAPSIDRTYTGTRTPTQGISLSLLTDRTLDITRTLFTPIRIFISLFTQESEYFAEPAYINPAAISKYESGDTVDIFVGLINKTGSPVTDYSTLRLTVYYPNMTIFFKDKLMETYTGGLYKYNFTAPETTGIYYGVAVAQDYSAYIIFEVIPPGPYNLNIEPNKNKVEQGEIFTTEFSINNLGDVEQTLKIHYELTSGTQSLYYASEYVVVNTTEVKTILRTINVPCNAPTGTATLELIIEQGDINYTTTTSIIITARPKGKYIAESHKITFNLTPEKQHLLITSSNEVIFNGTIHDGNNMTLVTDKYRFQLSKEDYQPLIVETTVDRDIQINSHLTKKSEVHRFLNIPTNIYKLLIVILILGIIYFSFSLFNRSKKTT